MAPVTGLPPFVITRGGDYFFAPGVKAIQEIAQGKKFDVDAPSLPYEGYSMGDAMTPTLLSEERIKGYMTQIFMGAKDVVRVGMPSAIPGDPSAAPVAFVARLAHVKQALAMRTDASNHMITSVPHYQEAVRTISTGQDMIVSTQPDSVTGAKRALMIKILEAGWAALSTPQESVYVRLARITKRSIEATLRRTASHRAIDIVHDLGFVTTYNVVSELFGTPGPDWLTEMAVALRFSRQHLTQIEPEWLAAIKASKPEDVGLATWQVWSILMFLDIVGNYLQQEELKALGVQAGREFLTHIDTLIVKARKQPLARRTPTCWRHSSPWRRRSRTRPTRMPCRSRPTMAWSACCCWKSRARRSSLRRRWARVVHTALTGGIDLSSLIQLLMKVTPSQAKFDEGIERRPLRDLAAQSHRQAADAAQQPG